jgi:WD40 repeat protein
MTCPCSRSRFRWLRNFCSLVCVVAGCCSVPRARAQDIDLAKPLKSIDEEVTAFAFGPEGRIVYSVRRLFKSKQYDMQRDDIWLLESNGKRRRLLNGDKFIRGTGPFTYSIDFFRWSPNGRMILAQLFTTSIVDERQQDATMTVVLEDSGKEVHIGAGDNVIQDSSDAFWLQDSTTIIYFVELIKPKILFSCRYVSLVGAPPGPVFQGRTFLDAAQVPHSNVAIVVERDQNLSGPPRLQRMDVLSQDDHELATLSDFSGGLSVSPSGKRTAHYLDKEILEVRDLTDPNKVARLRVGLGAIQWAPGESRLLLKRAPEKKSGDLVWIDIPPLTAPAAGKDPAIAEPTPISICHGLTYRDFAISPDGQFLAIVPPGKRNLLIYALPQR